MLTRVNFNIRFHKIKLSSVAVQNLRQKGTVHQGEVDVRGRPDFSRYLTLVGSPGGAARPDGSGRPHFSNFALLVRPRSEDLFVERRPFCETPPAVVL